MTRHRRTLLATSAFALLLVAFVGVPARDEVELPTEVHPRERADTHVSSRGAAFAALPRSLALDIARVELGRLLFHDTRLSRDDSVSCATCHDLAQAGANHTRVSKGVAGRLGVRNAPTVYNAALNFRQFWDGRAATLEEQVDGPLTRPEELDSSWELVLGKLRADPALVERFARSYPDGLSASSVRSAIATFERSLITPGCDFDLFLGGNEHALDRDARAGYALFREIGCSECHAGANIGGDQFQRVGRVRGAGASLARDLGRFAVTGDERDRHVFKVPSLRNVALTAPYFHDGSVPDLESAVRVMAASQLGYEPEATEIAHLVAFLEALTGERPRHAR